MMVDDFSGFLRPIIFFWVILSNIIDVDYRLSREDVHEIEFWPLEQTN